MTVGPILAVALTALVATSVAAHDPDVGRGVRQRAPALRPGMLVRDHGLAIVVPGRGQAVWGELKFLDGTYEVLQVATSRAGMVRLLQYGDETARNAVTVVVGKALADQDLAATGSTKMVGPASGSGSRRAECRDGSSNPYWWRTPDLRWRYRVRGTPRYLRSQADGVAPVVDTIVKANANVTDAHNICGRPDRIGATFHYLGLTVHRLDVTGGAHCSEGDHHSTIGFASLPSYSIAMTCVYQVRNHVAREADIRISTDVHWTLAGQTCTHGEYLEAAMTHEFGHVYGLAHVSTSSHPTLTMQPMIRYCTQRASSLGLGDLRGLERKY